MAIQRKPKSAAGFIGAAPDADKTAGRGTYDKGVAKGNKRQISLTIAPDLLRSVDEAAKRSGQTRAGVINMAIYRALEGDIFR